MVGWIHALTSSLHNIVFKSFRLFFLLWSLLAPALLSFRDVIVGQKVGLNIPYHSQ